jgi:apolipoprotein N-acyltransferase
VKPVSVIGEEIQKDPTSAIALANAIAQKNRHTAPPLVVRLFALFPVALMVLVDQRRRPIAATVAYAIGLFALNAWNLGRSPAFEPMAPGIALTIVALAITTAAALAGGVAARWFADRLMRLRPEAWTEAGPTAMPATAAPGPTASRTPARTTS